MNDHIDLWLEPYLDAELPAQQVKEIDSHLAECEACRGLVAQQRAISALLHEVPPAAGLKPESRFVAEVGMQIERHKSAPITAVRVLHMVWQLLPVPLLLAAGFIVSVSIIGALLGVFPGTGQALESQFPLFQSLQVNSEPWSSLFALLGSLMPLNWNWLSGFFALAAISIMYIAWLVSWLLAGRQVKVKTIFEGSN